MRLGALTTAMFALGLSWAPGPSAQVLERIPEVDFVRETALDDAGLLQWEPFEVPCPDCRGRKQATCRGCEGRELSACTECSGTKSAACRSCAGSGALLDPLLEMICPYCTGSAWYDCAQCAGAGSFPVNDGAGSSNQVKCGSCKRKGRFECVVCDGTRRLESVRVKRKPPAEASLKDLVNTRTALKSCLEELEPFEPLERASKTQKALAKMLAKPARILPPLKGMQELLDTVVEGLSKAGAQYEAFESRLTHQFLVFRGRTVYLLRFQIRVLDLYIRRAEHNESIED